VKEYNRFLDLIFDEKIPDLKEFRAQFEELNFNEQYDTLSHNQEQLLPVIQNLENELEEDFIVDMAYNKVQYATESMEDDEMTNLFNESFEELNDIIEDDEINGYLGIILQQSQIKKNIKNLQMQMQYMDDLKSKILELQT